MLKTRHLFAIFAPAILIVLFALIVRIIQYQPMIPEQREATSEPTFIPIFEDDPIVGQRGAPIQLIVFEDFGCPECRNLDFDLDVLLGSYGDRVKIIWKMLPVTRFPAPTDLAHEYGYCANDQGFFEKFKALAFANQDDLSKPVLTLLIEQIDLDTKDFERCLASGRAQTYLANNKELALLLNVQSLPAVFLESEQIHIPTNVDGWITVLGL